MSFLSSSQKGLAELKTSFDAMAVQHDGLPGVIENVYDQLGAEPPSGTQGLVARVTWMTDRVHELEVDALRIGVNRAFTIAHSHYEKYINLERLSKGYADVWSDEELAAIEARVEPLSCALADSMADAVLPDRG